MINKDKDETIIYVVRHGESLSNVYARENPEKTASQFGDLGSSLSKKGQDQSNFLANRLKKITFSAVYSSHLNRARETAEIIAAHYNLPVITDRSIRERFFGEPMSHIKKKEIEKKLKKLNEHKKFTFRYFPNGENGQDVSKRFKKFLSKVRRKNKKKTVLLVTHGYVMRSFLIAIGFAKYDELPPGSIKNGAYFVSKKQGKSYTISERYGITRNRGGYDDEE